MLDFDVQRCSRRCAKTDREFQPGETFFSVLVSQGAEVVRYDYCQEAWEAPPENAIGWWKSQLPESNARRANWAPNDVMLEFFQQLEVQPQRLDFRYVLALLMIRRRIVRVEDTEVDDSGREVLVLFCPRNETEYRVPVVMPDAPRAKQIQDELAELLYADPP
jgi:hypothetical protein